jgi:HipA-like C-terminal domain
MSRISDGIRLRLSSGPLTARQLIESIGISQPTLSRALAELSDEVVRIGAARSIRYLLRDMARGLPDTPIFCVDIDARVRPMGTLVPVRPNGFVTYQADGVAVHSAGLPWWLSDMRPQGFLGRAYAARHGVALGLPARLTEWSDTHAMRALLANGEDTVGNLLLGEIARDRFLAATEPESIAERSKPDRYAALAQDASRGQHPGSSAGGEQPKFTAFVTTLSGPRHVLVKFSELDGGPVSERWRDLLLIEHLALETLREAEIAAASTRVIDGPGQRFLEVERFDRFGPLGRHGVISLAALDAEFVGAGNAAWPQIARRLAKGGQILSEAADGAALLWAFGSLIGNSDMHSVNLSFVLKQGPPYALAPAYDMTSMCFAPRSGGGSPDTVPPVRFVTDVSNQTWQRADELAHAFLARVLVSKQFSSRFEPCISALKQHIESASTMIARLG